MNLAGKIFTVSVFLMSLVFMAFSIAVYATHRDYKSEILRPATDVQAGQKKGLKFQIEDQSLKLKTLQTKKTQIEAELTLEKTVRQQMVAMLEAEKVEVETRRNALIAEDQRLVRETAETVEKMKTTQESIANLRIMIETYNADVETATQQRDGTFAAVLELEDKLAQTIGEWERLNKRNEELAKDVARYGSGAPRAAVNRPAGPAARVAGGK